MTRLAVTRTGRVAELRLDRPDKRNAMDEAMMDALAEAGAALAAEDGLSAVILHGAGEAFCAGIDTALFARFAADLGAVRAEMLAPPPGAPNRFQRPCTVWASVPVPVIAAIHGQCFGAGMQLALGADFRIAAPDAQLSIMEAKWGLIPDMGLSQFLPRLMRADQALDLMLTARVVTGTEAAALGLVTRTATDPLAEARALAARLAGVSPDVLRGCKALVAASWHADPAALRTEAAVQAALLGGAH
ncbi:MAG: crotonase/enoyl-CoA hydratase family protein, partial [Gemmobacter sp.]